MDNILEITGLCKSYGDFALRDVSFALPRGFIMGFVGENGSGKTTTIRSILNMAKIDSGKISVFGLGRDRHHHHQGADGRGIRQPVHGRAPDGKADRAAAPPFLPELVKGGIPGETAFIRAAGQQARG